MNSASEQSFNAIIIKIAQQPLWENMVRHIRADSELAYVPYFPQTKESVDGCDLAMFPGLGISAWSFFDGYGAAPLLL